MAVLTKPFSMEAMAARIRSMAEAGAVEAVGSSAGSRHPR
jgi:DNA-binding response OmpR family regulator